MLSRQKRKQTAENMAEYRYNPQYQFKYFDLEENEWKTLSEAATLPHLASLVVAGNKLYAIVAGGSMYARGLQDPDQNPTSVKDFYEYDLKQNVWIKLPSMLKSHEIQDSQVVYMDGFIYVIGDQLYSGYVERYSLAEQRWEELPAMPDFYRRTSAIAYKGNILVYGISIDDSSHDINEYNPTTEEWDLVQSEPGSEDRNGYITSPALFVYQDLVYRVLYKKRSGSDGQPRSYSCTAEFEFPVVSQLTSLQAQGYIDGIIEVPQNRSLENTSSAFCIQNQIFVNNKGFIQLTDLRMSYDTDDHDLTSEKNWNRFVVLPLKGDRSNVIKLTFDKKKLGCIS